MNKKYRWLAVAAAVLLLAAILTFLIPGKLPITELKSGNTYQYKNLPWGVTEGKAKLVLFRHLKPDALVAQLEPGTQTYVAENAYIVDGQKASAYFSFRDGQLYEISFTFRNLESEDWFDNLLATVREAYGTETQLLESAYGVNQYRWVGEDSQLVLSSPPPDNSGPAHIMLNVLEN